MSGAPDDGADAGGLTVFTRRDGVIRHFWSQEMIASDPGQDPRGAPDPAPLWTVLDMTPEGRAAGLVPVAGVSRLAAHFARTRLFRGACSSSTRPRCSSTGGTYSAKRPRYPLRSP